MSNDDKTETEKKNSGTETSAADNLKYHVALWLVRLVAWTPFPVLYALSDLLFPVFYHLVRYRRKLVRQNLQEAFPEKSHGEIVSIERQFYHFFIDMALESCKLLTISREEMKRRLRFNNIELADRMLAGGQSISVFLGHYGNWEWLSTIALWLHEEAVVAQIYHKLRNKAMDRVMLTMRERMGHKCVQMYKTVRYMATAAADPRPHMIGFISDQSPKRREVKDFMRFLNHEIPVLTGSEKATKHFGYQAIFVGVRRVRRGFYECDLHLLADNPKALPDYELTRRYYELLEQEIRQHPELYLWSHNRFKYAVRGNEQN